MGSGWLRSDPSCEDKVQGELWLPLLIARHTQMTLLCGKLSSESSICCIEQPA